MDFCDDINKTKGRRALLHCVMSTKRQSQTIFSIILFRTNEIFKIKIWRTYSRVYSGHNCSCISNKACAIPLPETFYFNDVLQNWNRDCYSRLEKAGPFDCCCSHQSVASSSLCFVRAHDRHFEHIFWCFHCSVCLLLSIFEFWVLLFDCFVYRENATCLKRFTRYGYYTGEVEDIIIGRLAVASWIPVPKIRAFSCSFMMLC